MLSITPENLTIVLAPALPKGANMAATIIADIAAIEVNAFPGELRMTTP
ncbi:MAG: hypothetical protein MUE59_12105 [Thiobacillaceae bacterium]|nr:hypothetical protein [Thiobacillaceae bacterium]